MMGTEKGLRAFYRPKARLVRGTPYGVTFSGGTDVNRTAVAFTQFMFTTAGESPVDDRWIPTPDWRTDRPDSKWQALSPLKAGSRVKNLARPAFQLHGIALASRFPNV